MATIHYQEIFDAFIEKVTTYADDNFLQSEIQWLNAVISKPKIHDLFQSFSYDNEIMNINFELKYSISEQIDINFVIDLLSTGMCIEWLKPKVDSIYNISYMIGGKEEKVLINNHSFTIQRLHELKTEFDKMIRDYGYMYNSYINE